MFPTFGGSYISYIYINTSTYIPHPLPGKIELKRINKKTTWETIKSTIIRRTEISKQQTHTHTLPRSSSCLVIIFAPVVLHFLKNGLLYHLAPVSWGTPGVPTKSEKKRITTETAQKWFKILNDTSSYVNLKQSQLNSTSPSRSKMV